MFFINCQIQELQQIDYPLTRQPDFNSFWQNAVQKVKKHDIAAEMIELKDYPQNHIRIYDVTVKGLDGTPVKAWLLIPKEASTSHPVPLVVHFHGGGSSRGKWPLTNIIYALSGCAVLCSEFRLQGGLTGSLTPMHPCVVNSFVTYNLDMGPENYYFYHALTDQLAMIQFGMQLPQINPAKVAVMGASQGGGTALMMAALNPDIALCIASVPSYCCWERRIFTRTACAAQLARYLQEYPENTEMVFKTMSYFDAMNFADKIKCRVEMQVCLKDDMAPPDCAFAAYNRIKAQKNIRIYPEGAHHSVDYEQWLMDLQHFLIDKKTQKYS